MRRRFYYSKQAKSDLRHIIRNSVLLFGPRQADRYSDQIDRECEALAEGGARSRPVTTRDVSYLTRKVGSHVLICSMDPDGRLRVIRILHSRMDIQRHL